MSEFTKLYKAVVVVDTVLEKQLLGQFNEFGAKGYTCVYCFGRGKNPVYEEPWVGHSQSRIEIVTSREIAEKIIELVNSSEYSRHPVAGYIETVEVMHPERFV